MLQCSTVVCYGMSLVMANVLSELRGYDKPLTINYILQSVAFFKNPCQQSKGQSWHLVLLSLVENLSHISVPLFCCLRTLKIIIVQIKKMLL